MSVTVTKTDAFQVTGNAPVKLTITIGDGQSGGSDVRVDNATLGSGEITDVMIGAGQDLKTKSVDILTTVRRTNTATAHTSVRYTLRSGVQEQNYDYEAIVTQMGDRAIYDVSIVFT